LALCSLFLFSFGLVTLDWIVNTPIKAWEYLDLGPHVFLQVWYAYIISVFCLFFSGLLLGLAFFWQMGKQN
jgi:hypothetical protein